MQTEIITNAKPGRIVKRQDQEENILGFSIIGKIKIGQKVLNQNNKEIPQSIDYFRATGSHAEQFHQMLGEKPNKLRIVFPSPYPEVCCYQRIEGRDSEGNLAAISDGLNHQLWNSKANTYIKATNEDLEKAKNEGIEVIKGYGNNAKKVIIPVKNWAERLTLRFIVLEMKGILGVWELSTNGNASSIPNLIENFDKMAEKAGRNMHLVVFDLSVAFATSQKPGTMSRYPVLTLVPNLSYESAMKLNDFKNNDQMYSKLITDDTIEHLLLSGESNVPSVLALPEATSVNSEQGIGNREQGIVNSEQGTGNSVEPAPAPKNVAGNKVQSIEFSPDMLKNFVREAGLKNNKPVNPATITMLEMALLALTGYHKDNYKIILNYLTNSDDIHNVSQGEADYIIRWVGPVKDDTGTYVPKEFKRVAQANEIIEMLSDGVVKDDSMSK